MKKLKVLSPVIFVLSLMIALLACDKEYPVDTESVPTGFKATIQMDQMDMQLEELVQTGVANCSLCGCGTCTASLPQNVKWEQTHLARIDKPNHMIISSGAFKLVTETGDEISGTYYGTGSFNDLGDHVSADMILTVANGTGKYADKQGTLQARLRPAENNSYDHFLQVDGKIY